MISSLTPSQTIDVSLDFEKSLLNPNKAHLIGLELYINISLSNFKFQNVFPNSLLVFKKANIISLNSYVAQGKFFKNST